MVAGLAALAVAGTVLIVNNAGGGGRQENTIPTANEVALQPPQDPGPAPFTPSVETQAVQAPAPPSTPAGTTATRTDGATATAALRSVEGTSAGVYGGTMNKPSCDVEHLVSITSTGDTGRAWASAQGIEQSAVPGYLRSLTSAYLRVDTRVTNHGYQGGAAVAYQSVLQAGTAVLVDAQGVPRVRCGCGNPLKPPTLVSDAKYTGKAWAGFQPSALIVVVAAPKPVTEIVLVDVTTGGWFARGTGQVKVVDRPAPAPTGALAPGVPAASVWKTASPTASGPTSGSTSATTSGATTSGATTSGATTSGSATSGSAIPTTASPTATTTGPTTPGATTTGTPSSPTTPAQTTPAVTTPAQTTPAQTTPPPTTTAKPTVTVTSTPAATATTAKTATATTTTTTAPAGTATGTTATNTSVEEPATATGSTG
ncbi:DUF6777 domain-containing protein [Kitasatospora sp. NPDC057500]|uniref:DUF6777 domain-containing protein n=1 Tax=Kitasatospora sp. NPDC057500 TaxID=3346151 RepID=UPI0036BB871C